MSKEAEILRKWMSCHGKHMYQNSRKSRESMYLSCVNLTKSDSQAVQMWLGLYIVVMITNIDLSQEIFAIVILTF